MKDENVFGAFCVAFLLQMIFIMGAWVVGAYFIYRILQHFGVL